MPLPISRKAWSPTWKRRCADISRTALLGRRTAGCFRRAVIRVGAIDGGPLFRAVTVGERVPLFDEQAQPSREAGFLKVAITDTGSVAAINTPKTAALLQSQLRA